MQPDDEDSSPDARPAPESAGVAADTQLCGPEGNPAAQGESAPEPCVVMTLRELLDDALEGVSQGLRWRIVVLSARPDEMLVRAPRRLVTVLLGRLVRQLFDDTPAVGGPKPLLAALLLEQGAGVELTLAAASTARHHDEARAAEVPSELGRLGAVKVLAQVLASSGGTVTVTRGPSGEPVLRVTLPRLQRETVPPSERPTNRPPTRAAARSEPGSE